MLLTKVNTAAPYAQITHFQGAKFIVLAILLSKIMLWKETLDESGKTSDFVTKATYKRRTSQVICHKPLFILPLEHKRKLRNLVFNFPRVRTAAIELQKWNLKGKKKFEVNPYEV